LLIELPRVNATSELHKLGISSLGEMWLSRFLRNFPSLL
jgi:hypothetical protein